MRWPVNWSHYYPLCCVTITKYCIKSAAAPFRRVCYGSYWDDDSIRLLKPMKILPSRLSVTKSCCLIPRCCCRLVGVIYLGSLSDIFSCVSFLTCFVVIRGTSQWWLTDYETCYYPSCLQPLASHQRHESWAEWNDRLNDRQVERWRFSLGCDILG